jgi:type IV pilus assembly protein PilB
MLIKSSLPRLGIVLLQAQLVSEAELTEAIHQARQAKQSLLAYVLQSLPLSANAVSQACAAHFGLPHRELQDFSIENLPFSLINEAMIRQHPVLPLVQIEQQLLVAVSDPDDFSWLEDIQYQTGLITQAVMTPYDQLTRLINRLFADKNYVDVVHAQTPAVAFVEQILVDALYRNASDIHCEPTADQYRVRMRIDGLLYEVAQAPASLANAIISRLKILAQCDIAERRLPQDGRFTFTAPNGLNRDCRLSSCPTIFGEKIVVRLLDNNKKLLTLLELGLTDRDQTVLHHALNQPQGLILVTGPTGSGKTITLYSALEYLNRKTHNILTVEEPVEISLAGINQVNVHEKAGLTFSTVLKAFLRQDPDIMMVGEIRDKETAAIAVHAAQTGHLVLSTLHTNSAADTVVRLMNMGIAPFNIADSLRLVIAQRLVRKRCHRCQQGCHYCTDGYQGREGVFELMPISKALSTVILEGNKADITQQAEREGMQTLWQAALQKVEQGITSMEEIYRVVSSYA